MMNDWIKVLAVLSAFSTNGAVLGQAPPEADTVRVLAYNIRHGEGMDGRVDLDRIADVILRHEPDLVALQEVDNGVERTGHVDQAAVLADRTGMFSAFGAFMDYQGGQYGMAILSRWPVLKTVNHRLPDGAEPRTALAATVRLDSGRELEFVGVHLYKTETERVAQANRLLEIYDGWERPVILAGDFNSRPESTVLDTLVHLWRFVEKRGQKFTFPSNAPEREIDYVACAPGPDCHWIEEYVGEEPLASDHRPVLSEICLGNKDLCQHAIGRLAWLSGCWRAESPGRMAEEHWTSPRGNNMIGMTRSMRADTLRGYELLVLKETEGALVLEARPSGQPGTTFTATSVTDKEVVFENPEHDFPQRLGYAARGDSLVGWIDGSIDGQTRTITFPYRRVQCEPD